MNQLSNSHQSDTSVFANKKIPIKSAKPKQVGFATQLLITLLLLAILFGITLFVAYKLGYKEKPSTNFEECKNAKGSIIQESYPEVCVTKDGQHFTQDISEDELIFCGGISGKACPEGYYCQYESVPDAGGVCIKN